MKKLLFSVLFGILLMSVFVSAELIGSYSIRGNNGKVVSITENTTSVDFSANSNLRTCRVLGISQNCIRGEGYVKAVTTKRTLISSFDLIAVSTNNESIFKTINFGYVNTFPRTYGLIYYEVDKNTNLARVYGSNFEVKDIPITVLK